MAAPHKSSTLPRTDVAAFLRSVGAELRAADEFLCRTGAPVAALQPPAGAPLLLQQPEAVAAATGVLRSGSTSGTGSSDAAAGAAPESEVAALMGLMVPAQEHPVLQHVCKEQALPAPAEEQAVHASKGRPAALAAPACTAAAPGTSHRAAAPEYASGRPADQHTPADLRRSRAKVLSWLSHSGGDSRQLSDDSPTDAIPAVHATASWPPAAQQVGRTGDSWRQLQRAAAPLLRSPVQQLAPADYCAQLRRAGTPRRLMLARLACPGCGQAGAACSCPEAVGAAPLRLLRPRQAPYASPARQRGSGSGQQTGQQHDHSSLACAAGPAPGPTAAGTAACVTIQNAYFGGAGMLQGSSHTVSAVGQWQPAAAPPLAQPPIPPPAGAQTGSSAGTEQPRLDVWAAYLAARRQAVAADGGQPGTGEGSGGGPLAELRCIAQRIRTMQGHISSFLLRPYDPEPLAGGPPLQGAFTSDSKQWESGGVAPLPAAAAPVALPAAGARPRQPASAPPAQRWEPGSLFTDDFILSIQMGTDWRRLERAALEAAAGRSSAQGAGAGAGAADGRSGEGTVGGSGALQRLKQAQRVVTAERVGRQPQRAC